MGRDGVGMRISYTRPIPFNFLNWMRMKIILNKQGKVGMRVTRIEPAPLSSLFVTSFENSFVFSIFL